MKNNTKFFLSILTLVFVLSACKKYEEGPAISILTKKARVTGAWKAEKKISNSGEVDYVFDDEVIRINKDDTYEIHEGNELVVFGTWDFTKDKEYLRFTFTENGSKNIQEFKIIRLKNKELWLTDDQGEQINYVPA